jgi:DNA-binding FrmR family transcriptional regulator
MPVSEETKEDLFARLEKARGQLSGLQRMIENGEDCTQFLTQISAVRAAIGKVGMIIVQNYMRDCLDVSEERKVVERRGEDLVGILSRLIR